MARIAGSVVAFLLLASIVVSEAYVLIPKCCQDYHAWGENDGCAPPLDPLCNSWCQNRCTGGKCKIMGGKHYCHCNCH